MTPSEPRIETLDPRKLIGMRVEMSPGDDRTRELWQRFMPRREEVRARVRGHYISMTILADPDGNPAGPDTRIEKWAAVEVADHDDVPAGMEPHTMRGGKYAVFVHEGPASRAAETFGYIFGTWLPRSGYALDSREHFEILPEDYRPDDPRAREEVWIPVRPVQLPRDG